MKYMGSKAKIAKFIVPIIQQKIDESGARYYIEPFAGGCNVIDKVKAKYRIASDKNEYLIALFRHLQAGGELPEHITREEYNAVREAYNTKSGGFPKWYIGAVGFLASYNGRFYDGGYAGYGKDKGRVRDYYKESRNNILKQMQQGGIFDIDFACRDYKEFTPQGCVIYCDPPYEGTKQYGNAKDFDYAEFWEVMRKWSRHNNIVLISELQAPDDFTVIWEKEVDRSMKAKEHFRATEKLFMWGERSMIKRGDIYFIRDTRQSIGSEQRADRPAVIVSNNTNNKHSGVYEVVYMTTQPKTDLPTHFITNSSLRTSTVLCEQISSVYEDRIGEWIGTLTPEELKQLDKCLAVSVGIDAEAPTESLRQQLAAAEVQQQATEKQMQTYKEMYEFLLSKRLAE